MLNGITIDQLSVINRAIRTHYTQGIRDSELTRQLTVSLIERYPTMTACEALSKIHNARIALDL